MTLMPDSKSMQEDPDSKSAAMNVNIFLFVQYDIHTSMVSLLAWHRLREPSGLTTSSVDFAGKPVGCFLDALGVCNSRRLLVACILKNEEHHSASAREV